MDFNLPQRSDVSDDLISHLHQTLQQESVSREFHAFCHLCPPDAPAATELRKLDKQALLEWSQKCKEAINQWCCCPRDYEATPNAPSLTTRDSRLPLLVKSRDGGCIITRAEVEICHAAHIFLYYLGKSREESKRSIWNVIEMFWGKERKEALYKCIFGDRNLVSPNSKTLINRLYNMVTLSPDLHARWGLGYFILEPLAAESTTLELKIRFQWTPNHQITDGVTIETLPSSLETPPKPKFLMNEDTGELIQDGHIVTLRTVDPIKTPLPSLELLNLQCHLVRVLRMAGRAGGDMLETIESDFDISSVAASDHLETDINASSSQTAFWAGNIGFDRPQLTDTPYFLNTEPPGKAPLADGSSEDENSSPESPDTDNIAVLAAKSIEPQTVPYPPSASGKSHLKKRHLPHVLVPFSFHNFIEKTGKSTFQLISARFQKLRK